MKKSLLFGAVALAGTFALSAQPAMDDCLELVWQNKNVASIGANNARQGFGKDGKFYLQNYTTQKIEVWDQTGKIDEINSGAGTNISFDDAGNIIVRGGGFPTHNEDGSDQYVLISSDFSTNKTIDVTKQPSGRHDFFGHTNGDVFSEEGAFLYTFGQWDGSAIREISIISGEQDVDNSIIYSNYTSPFGVSGNASTTALISAWQDYDFIAILSPLGNTGGGTTLTDCNSIEKFMLDEDMNWSRDSYFITPRHSGATGFYIFTVGGQDYIVYASGENFLDGFSVAKLATKDNYEVEDSDMDYLVGTKYSEVNPDGTAVYDGANTFYGVHFSVDVISDTEAYIYQFMPGAYIAQFKFTAPAAGVEGVDAAPAAKVYGGDGKIIVSGDAESIEVYNVGGVLVSENDANVECAPGMYLVKVDGNVTKVVVK